MSHNILVCIPGLAEEQVLRIRASAEQLGFQVSFCSSVKEAMPYLPEAQVIFGQEADLARFSPKLKWICSPSAGINQFCGKDVFANPCAVLSNSSGAYGVTIAEHVVMVTLETLRRQKEYDAMARAHVWRRDLAVKSIFGSCVVLLGAGDIGRETAKRFRAFSPESIIAVNRSGAAKGDYDAVRRVEELNGLLPECDILVISLPGTPETHHMIDAQRLSLLPDGALIVNVGRGSVIDTPALVRELTNGRLKAVLDVFETEPLPKDDPLWECPNLIITQHTAGNMTLPYTVRRIVDLFLEDLARFARGETPLQLVDRTRGY